MRGRFWNRSVGPRALLAITALSTLHLANAHGQEPMIPNLALPAHGANVHTWQPNLPVIPGNEPEQANDGSQRTFWLVEARDLPADLGIEWPAPQEVSSVIIRYRTKSFVPTPTDSRSQPFAHLQSWDGSKWIDLDARCGGEITRIARYTFPPVKTTRIRAIFEELPTINYRPSITDPPVCVSEIEAYSRPPFQQVEFWKPAGHYVQNVGSVTIEPKQTRVFNDVLTPTLIVAESEWAKKPCSASKPAEKKARLENGFLQLDLSADGGLAETGITNRVTGETVATPQAEPFIIRTNDGELRAKDFQVKSLNAQNSTPDSARSANAATIRVELTSPKMDAVVFYDLQPHDHFYHKWMTLTPKGDAAPQLLDVTLSALHLPKTIGLSAGESQELSYPITMLEKGGLFAGVETVVWDHRGDAVTYYPGITLKSGQTFTTEKGVVGVFKKRGEIWNGVDRGVREWLIEYHVQVSPIPWSWPDIYCEGWSAKVGIEEVKNKTEWLEGYFKRISRLGVRYMDGYEPLHLVMMESPADVDKWLKMAEDNKISTGFWLDHSLKYMAKNPKYPPFTCCLSPEAERYYEDILKFVRDHHLKAFHWGDFLQIMLCNETNHGHLPGKYSLYPQAMRILKLSQDIHATDPHVRLNADMGWFNPQWARFVDSGAHIDSFDARAAIEPDLHLDRMYADMNRGYMHVSHGIFLHPWYRNLNCVNHFGQESHHHDLAGFRYSMLATLGVAAQMVFNDAPDNTPESEYAFSQRWIAWGKENKDYLKQGDILFDRSTRHVKDAYAGDADAMSGFAHIRKDRGFVFLMNPTVCEQIADLKLALDAPEDQRFQVDEVFPGDCSLRGPADGFYRLGGVLRVTVPAKQVRVLWIAPVGSGQSKPQFQPEDFRVKQYRRYSGDWKIVDKAKATIGLKSSFAYPATAAEWLKSPAPDAEWRAEPWAHNKAYLVLLLSEERRDPLDLWVSDSLFVVDKDATEKTGLRINGVDKPIYPLILGNRSRAQEQGVTRCYFVSLGDETKVGADNEIELRLPLQSQLAFAGAYLDLPDQMPEGPKEPGGHATPGPTAEK